MSNKRTSILAFAIAVGLSAPALADPVAGRPIKPACKADKTHGSVQRPKDDKCDKTKPVMVGTGFGAGVGTGTSATTTAMYVGFGILATTAILVVADHKKERPVSQ